MNVAERSQNLAGSGPPVCDILLLIYYQYESHSRAEHALSLRSVTIIRVLGQSLPFQAPTAPTFTSLNISKLDETLAPLADDIFNRYQEISIDSHWKLDNRNRSLAEFLAFQSNRFNYTSRMLRIRIISFILL